MEFKYELIEGGIKLLDVTLNEDETHLEIAEIGEIPVIEIVENFLYYNESLTSISLPNVKEIGGSFLYWNESLTQISLPNVEKIDGRFLEHNRSLIKIDFNISALSRAASIRILKRCPNLDTDTLYRFYRVEDQEVKKLVQEHPNWEEPTDWVLGDW